jgi:hypothetical protein
VSDPSTFISLATVNYNPTLPLPIESATRATILSETGGAIAANVSKLKFDFTSPAGENGYSGYAEIEVFGGVSATVYTPTIATPTFANGNATIQVSGGQPNGAFTWLTSTNIAAPLSTWTTYTTGTFDANGNYSVTLPMATTDAARFFIIKPQ